MARRLWTGGKKSRVEGAPFAQWAIHQVNPLPGSVLKHTVYPDASQDEGEAHMVLGDVLLVPESKTISIRPARGCNAGDVWRLMEWAKDHRDSDDFGSGLTPETAGEEIVLGTVAKRWDVFRCDVEGCDKFGMWHRKQAYRSGLKSLYQPHTAQHMSLSGVYECELRFGLDGWQPYVDILCDKKSMSISEAANLASDITWILAEARKLNHLHSTTTERSCETRSLRRAA